MLKKVLVCGIKTNCHHCQRIQSLTRDISNQLCKTSDTKQQAENILLEICVKEQSDSMQIYLKEIVRDALKKNFKEKKSTAKGKDFQRTIKS